MRERDTHKDRFREQHIIYLTCKKTFAAWCIPPCSVAVSGLKPLVNTGSQLSPISMHSTPPPCRIATEQPHLILLGQTVAVFLLLPVAVTRGIHLCTQCEQFVGVLICLEKYLYTCRSMYIYAYEYDCFIYTCPYVHNYRGV